MALPDYLQETAKDYAKQLTATTSAPINTGAFTGRQFVAGEDPLQTQAINLAQQGVGAYQPYLQAAQAAQQQAATTIGGMGSLTGAQAYQPFMSPYQSSVIDETLRQYDLSRQAGLQDISDKAYASGAFGGGRQGALEGQYMADTAANRAGITAQLLQSGFMNAQNAAQQAFQNQQTLAGLQSGLGANQLALSNFEAAGRGADVGALGQLGAFRQGLEQSRLQADIDAARTGAYEPYQRLSTYGTGLTGLAGGVAGQQFATPATPSPLATSLSTALGIGGLFGKIYG